MDTLTNIAPFCVSITGVDNSVHVEDLVALSRQYPFVEWGVLYCPTRDGTARYPTPSWRDELARARVQHGLLTALHLHDDDVFWKILGARYDKRLPLHDELGRYRRVQVNINARKKTFRSEDVFAVYQNLASHEVRLIFQYHDGTASAINRYLDAMTLSAFIRGAYLGDFAVLFDESRGGGVAPDTWHPPFFRYERGLQTGYAGGISPENIEAVLDSIAKALVEACHPEARYWLEMASGVRTEDRIDLQKIERVLSAVARRMNTEAAR